ncbi:MAG: glycosyltransferase family 2 protein [Cyanobacteria bacterium P01_A01_bin.84]
MNELVTFLSFALLLWLSLQLLLSFLFLWYVRSTNGTSLPDEELPKAAIILCLRGSDPFLEKCLRSLLQQNYPEYHLKLVVDHEDDPSWVSINNIITEYQPTNMEVRVLRERRETCSLKCSSIVQAVSELDNSYSVVAFVDADAVVHPDWLRQLVSPLADPRVGATTGNRWYLPNGKLWGSLIRYIWNLSAVVQMYLYKIPWGGTLAIKTQLIRETGLLDKWKYAYADDTSISRTLAAYNKQVKFIPSLIIVNREECSLPSLFGWIRRQVFSSRVYHPFWLAVVGDALLTVFMPNLLLILGIKAFVSQEWNIAIIAFSSYGTYIFGLLLIAIALEKVIQQIISLRGEPISKLSFPTIIKIFLGTPIAQWFYSIALIFSYWMPKVVWRGVEYRIKGPWDVRLLKYKPYQRVRQDRNGRDVSL